MSMSMSMSLPMSMPMAYVYAFVDAYVYDSAMFMYMSMSMYFMCPCSYPYPTVHIHVHVWIFLSFFQQTNSKVTFVINGRIPELISPRMPLHDQLSTIFRHRSSTEIFRRLIFLIRRNKAVEITFGKQLVKLCQLQ